MIKINDSGLCYPNYDLRSYHEKSLKCLECEVIIIFNLKEKK
jgi:hypothetical protein